MSPEWRPPYDLDFEIRELCIQMNRFPGIQTTCSCCGHGKRPIGIFFLASLEDLPPLLYWCDHHGCACHSGVRGWVVKVYTDCTMRPASFLLEGPAGDYEGAAKIAAKMKEFLDDNSNGD